MGRYLRRQDDHFVQDSSDGADEIEEPGELLSESCLVLKTFDRDIKLYSLLCGTIATNGQVFLVNMDDWGSIDDWGALSGESKKVFNTLWEWPLFSINEKLNRIRTRVEKG
jgi:hypothetical protein